MRIILPVVFIGILCCQSLLAQVVTDKTNHDFGEIEAAHDKFVDFKFTNISDHAISITRVEEPYGISVLLSSKQIKPDASILVRVKYTPKRKGEFHADVPIYLSSNTNPIVLSVSGNANSVNMDETLEVPEFKEVQEKKAARTFDLDIEIVRKDNGDPVSDAKLDIIWDGVMYRSLKSDDQGIVKADYVADKYYMVVRAEGLGGFESELNIHPNVKKVLIELGPEGTLSQVTTDSTDVYETEIVEIEDDEEEKSVEPVVEEVDEKVEPENPSFSDREFIPNNIVFLIDVSVSMRQKGKMNLLKSSLIELTNLLRSVDKVAIVTYSSKANLVLRSTPASEKEKIINVIQNLQPKGSTSSQRGLKKAYQVLHGNAIQNGNNQVFITTDGAFNLDRQDRDMLDIVRKNSKKGYKISVIGIKNDMWTVKNMKLIAKEGHGNYIHIRGYEDAKRSLVEEVKLQSRHN